MRNKILITLNLGNETLWGSLKLPYIGVLDLEY
jgi:hypothetical protein